MDEPGWYSLVPFYGPYVLYRHTWGPNWWIPFFGPIITACLLSVVPSSILDSDVATMIDSLVTLGLSLVTYINLYAGFGHGVVFSVFGTIFPFITIPICALGSDEYVGGRR
jgi:hypothetical protein